MIREIESKISTGVPSTPIRAAPKKPWELAAAANKITPSSPGVKGPPQAAPPQEPAAAAASQEPAEGGSSAPAVGASEVAALDGYAVGYEHGWWDGGHANLLCVAP